jgi:hypothetical protein
VRRLLGTVLLGITLAATAACGSDEPSLQQGRAIASKARAPVEREYKNVSDALQAVSEQDVNQRSAYTRVCRAAAGKPPDQVAYDITNLVDARGKNLTAIKLLPLLEQTLRGQGWKGFKSGYGSLDGGFTPASRYWTGSKGQFTIILQPQTGNQKFFTSLVVAGPCVRVGNDFVATVPRVNQQRAG